MITTPLGKHDRVPLYSLYVVLHFIFNTHVNFRIQREKIVCLFKQETLKFLEKFI